MSLAFPARAAPVWTIGLAVSAAAHAAVLAAFLAQPVAPPPAEAGLKGREFIDLADVDMILAAPETDLAQGEAATDSAAQMDSPEKTEPARAANDPILAQIPDPVADPELQFRISTPDDPVEAKKDATEVATEVQDKTHTEFAPPSTAASPAPSAGDQPQSGSTEAELGLSDEDRARIEDWQKAIVLALAAAKTYPKAARNARTEGKVILGFSLDSYGRVVARSVLERSGHPVLDQAALALIDGLAGLPAPPAAMGPGPFPMRVPIVYSVK
ncbi:energy transducer TonB [Phaeovulum sp. NW3]|uniref:energy transducer TonB family protein n=1 Tax=Phaeovulum sp. NW3 TaxID=2934933 RepID=UPI0020205062|nr:energy transducer TonB [Phaeovulum sp. NW3]MCL7465309.1 TonB family protein [Phaeovulum sp. NW3]